MRMTAYRVEHMTGSRIIHADSATEAWGWAVRYGLTPTGIERA